MHGGLSHFKATLQRRKERNHSKDRSAFKGMTDGDTSNKKAANFDFPKMSDIELKEFKDTLVKQRKYRERRDILSMIFSILITLLFFYFI